MSRGRLDGQAESCDPLDERLDQDDAGREEAWMPGRRQDQEPFRKARQVPQLVEDHFGILRGLSVEVRVAFQKFMAFGRVAHSRIDFPYEAYNAYRDGGGKTMPIVVRIIRGHTYITDNFSGVAGISPGDEIFALNGQPMSVWMGVGWGSVPAKTYSLARPVSFARARPSVNLHGFLSIGNGDCPGSGFASVKLLGS